VIGYNERVSFRHGLAFGALVGVLTVAIGTMRGAGQNEIMVIALLVVAAVAAPYLALHEFVRRRFVAAVYRSDPRELERFGRLLVRFNGREKRPLLTSLVDHSIAEAEGRWADGVLLCRRLLGGELQPKMRTLVESDLAWGLLMTGELVEGLALAQRALPAQGVRQVELRAAVEQTHAVALFLSGRITEAHAELERLSSLPSRSPRAKAIRWFYLGEARQAVGRPDAVGAWKQAVASEPGGPWGNRAEARLAATAAYR